jgi:prepilin-type N-terminal cleavage/methylation domain-containing protein
MSCPSCQAESAALCFSSLARRWSKSRPDAAFTLVELLAVIALIGVIAGLTLAGLGYVQQKSAMSRAEVEVASLSAAIESFKMDYGAYPGSVDLLFPELTGAPGATVNTNGKVFFETTARMVTNNRIIDPWGAPYNYTTNANRNVGFFDLWTVPPKARDESDWIHN